MCSLTQPNAKQANELSTTTDPRSCARVVYIAGDTLRHQPMGAGHMTVLQLRGPMAFRVLQWCHPMLASTTRTSCCTRMITLYGAGKWIQARAMGAIPILCINISITIDTILKFDTNTDANANIDAQCEQALNIRLENPCMLT